MFSPLFILAIITCYIGLLFIIALWVERGSQFGRRLAESPVVYSLALAVYCTSWTFYGSVGKAASGGMLFLTIYLGPTIAITGWWLILRKLIRIKSTYRITSIADFISARYGKSNLIAAIATLLALIGTTPYIALQLKAVSGTFSILTTGNQSLPWLQEHLGLWIVAMMAFFTIMFGARRLDPTERHEGIVLALAVECVVKLIAFLAAGIFVTYFMFDGFGDIFARLNENPVMNLLTTRDHDANSYLTWMTMLLLAASAIMFLPRQFHISVVENSNINHIRTAIWLFPLYMLLINIFVVPIAAGGLLSGFPVLDADTFVLTLPLAYGPPLLGLLVFIGGFSAATGMVIVSAMTTATMTTNHLVLPLIARFNFLAPLKKNLLQVRWLVIITILLLGHLFSIGLGDSHTLVNMGLISFAAVLQFAPPIIGGLFWHRGNKTGAFWGLSTGTLIWIYTMLLPSFAQSGWIPNSFLDGPFGITFLCPEHLFGASFTSPLVNTVFWSMFFNIGGFVLGSLMSEESIEDKQLTREFVNILSGEENVLPGGSMEKIIDWPEKKAILEKLLDQYLPPHEVAALINRAVQTINLKLEKRISIVQLAELSTQIEHYLSGIVGSAWAHQSLKQAKLFSDEEAQLLKNVFSEILVNLRVSPEELKKKIDYYQEKENLLTTYSNELEEKVNERTRDLQAAADVIHVATSIILVEDLVKTVVNLIKERFDLAYVGLFLNDETSQQPVLTADAGEACTSLVPSGNQVLPEDGAIGRCIAGKGQVIKVDPNQHDPEITNSSPNCYCTELALPLKIGERIIGALYIQSLRVETFGQEGEISVFQTLSDQIAIAISNARMVEKIQLELGERKKAEQALEKAYSELKQTQSQLLQREKMASVGQLAAGVAHEINNPMGFITSNINTLGKYVDKLVDYFNKQEEALKSFNAPEKTEELAAIKKKMKIDYVLEDISDIISESLDGANRVHGIVNNLKSFSRVDDVGKSIVDINSCIESTLNIVWNEIKYKATVEKEYGTLPKISCFPQQLNQVFMNILVNAAQALENQGTIRIRTQAENEQIIISITDNGSGIPADKMQRIFEPFFTTKEVGKGTGLGLSISYDIIKKHGGEIRVESEIGKGTTFTITLPVKTPED